MKILCDERTHCYTIDGDIANISTTELLHKHGLAPDYSAVPKADLKTASERGKAIHKELELLAKLSEYEPTTAYGEQFKDWCLAELGNCTAEQCLTYFIGDYSFVGTADLICKKANGEICIIDYKNTKLLNKEYVTWQTSLYGYYLRHNPITFINEVELRPYITDKLSYYCFHFADDKMEIVPLEPIPDSEIEKLLMCEFRCEKYQRPQLVISEELTMAVEQAEAMLAEIELQKKVAEEKAKALRQQLCELCEKQNITKWESPNGKVKLTYVGKATKQGIDSLKLKREYPQAFINCQKFTQVKGYVKITFNDEDF